MSKLEKWDISLEWMSFQIFGGISCKCQEFCRILPLNKLISARYFMQFQVLWNDDLWNI